MNRKRHGLLKLNYKLTKQVTMQKESIGSESNTAILISQWCTGVEPCSLVIGVGTAAISGCYNVSTCHAMQKLVSAARQNVMLTGTRHKYLVRSSAAVVYITQSDVFSVPLSGRRCSASLTTCMSAHPSDNGSAVGLHVQLTLGRGRWKWRTSKCRT